MQKINEDWSNLWDDFGTNEETLEEENNNFRSDKAKNKLIDKYLKDCGMEEIADKKAFKKGCLLHHLNGNHNDDKNLENDLLIVADNENDAKLAHKILHLLSYCAIRDELISRLGQLGIDLYYFPDTANKPVTLSIDQIATTLAQHNKSLRDISLIDQDETDSDTIVNNYFRTNRVL